MLCVRDVRIDNRRPLLFFLECFSIKCERHECADEIGTVMSEIVARSSLRCPIRFTVTSTVIVLVEARRCRMEPMPL